MARATSAEIGPSKNNNIKCECFNLIRDAMVARVSRQSSAAMMRNTD